jgi:oxygen-independent coproporphyrinogen-3 oxidase
VRKCPYCDSNSYEAKTDVPDQRYVDALLRDLDTEIPLARERPLQSVFIGGGTPSLFSGAAIERLIGGVRTRLTLDDDAEITLEANPGAVEAERFVEFREAGVNRLSIGVQSFRAPQLAVLGRIHDATEAVRAFDLAKRAGFDNINLDLMYGLPGDDLDGALGDLETALELGPTHLSWYQLTLEPNTAFFRHPPPLPAEELIIEIEQRGRERLAAGDFARYEVSAYERPGNRCVHNLNYWQFGDYLGVGAGAHGKLTVPEDGRIERRAKQRNPRTYMLDAGLPAAVTVDSIDSPRTITLEFLMNALRLPEGVPIALYTERTGQPLEAIESPVCEGERRGWLAADEGLLKPTPAGLEALNALLELF